MTKTMKRNPECRFEYCMYNSRTSFAHPGWLCAIFTISALVFGLGIDPSDNFIVSTFLLATPLFFNYIGHEPPKYIKWRRCLWIIEVIVSGIPVILAFLGFVGVFQLSLNEGVVYYHVNSEYPMFASAGFRAFWIWVYMLILAGFTFLDANLHDTPDDKEGRKEIEKVM